MTSSSALIRLSPFSASVPQFTRCYATRSVRVMELNPKKPRPRLIERYLITDKYAKKPPEIPPTATKTLFRSATITPELPADFPNPNLQNDINMPFALSLTAPELHYLFNLIPRAYMSAPYIAQISALNPGNHSRGLRDALDQVRDPSARSTADDIMLAAKAEPTDRTERLAVLSRRLDIMRKLLGMPFAAAEEVGKWNIARSVEIFQAETNDTNSPSVQVATMSARIHRLEQHLLRKRHDHQAGHKLLVLGGKRFKRMRHLRRINFTKFNDVIRDLGIDYDVFNNCRVDFDEQMMEDKKWLLIHRRRKK